MNPNIQRHYRQWVAGHGRRGRPVRALLRVASWAYGLGVGWRRGLYGVGLLRRVRPPVPVISIGNITAGGTGKTPLTIHLGQELRDRGLRAAVVTRGYGGTREGRTVVVSDGQTVRAGYPDVGDEALLLARKLPGVVVLMSADRVKGCRVAVREFGAQVILLDDGFQHLRVARDLDIVLLDRENPFGYGYLLPRGLLREPVRAIRRADLLVMTGVGDPGEPTDALSHSRDITRVPILHAVYTPTVFTDVMSGQTVAEEDLRGQRFVAFSGIANPSAFDRTLASLGKVPKRHLIYPDHHPYSAADIATIAECMKEVGATVALTTEKDAVRIEKLPVPFPVRAVGVSLTLTGGQPELKRFLDTLFP